MSLIWLKFKYVCFHVYLLEPVYDVQFINLCSVYLMYYRRVHTVGAFTVMSTWLVLSNLVPEIINLVSKKHLSHNYWQISQAN